MRGVRGGIVGVCIGMWRITDLGFVEGVVTLFSVHTGRSHVKEL